MQETSYDLSRRVKLFPLSVLSFREYILFTKGIALDKLSLSDIVNNKISASHRQFEYLFDEYIRGKLLPFALEESDYLPLLRNIVNKVVERDIPSVADLKTRESRYHKTSSIVYRQIYRRWNKSFLHFSKCWYNQV